jgi:hypothetical protein
MSSCRTNLIYVVSGGDKTDPLTKGPFQKSSVTFHHFVHIVIYVELRNRQLNVTSLYNVHMCT